MNKTIAGATLGLAIAFAATTAQADVIWSDDFERGDSNTVGNGWNEIEGNYKDVSVQENSSYGYMRIKEQSSGGGTIGASQENIDTDGYGNLSIEFKWKPFSTENNDSFSLDFQITGYSWQTIFNETLGGSENWQTETISLAFLGDTTDSLDIRFLLDASYKNEGVKIKYVKLYGDMVTTGGGTSVPEPGTLALFGTAIAGFGIAALRRRRRG